jgi:hypothetical protein
MLAKTKDALITMTGSVLAALITTAATIYAANVASVVKLKELEEKAENSAASASTSAGSAFTDAESVSRLAALLKKPTYFPSQITLGEVPMKGDISKGVYLSLPQNVPKDAKYAYILVTVTTGNTFVSKDGFVVATSTSSLGVEKIYAFVRTYRQEAISYTTSAAWMPISDDRQIHAEFTSDAGALPGNASATALVHVIAFR